MKVRTGKTIHDEIEKLFRNDARRIPLEKEKWISGLTEELNACLKELKEQNEELIKLKDRDKAIANAGAIAFIESFLEEKVSLK